MMQPQLLHGKLVATVYGLDRKISSDSCGCTGGGGGSAQSASTQSWSAYVLNIIKRFLLCRSEVNGIYATIDLDTARVGRTQVISATNSGPKWNQNFDIYCAHKISNIIFTVKFDDAVDASLIGRARLPVEELLSTNKAAKEIDKSIPILDKNGRRIPGKAMIHVKFQFFSVKRDEHWSKGIQIRPDYDFRGVPNTYFAQRENCRVTLYADAHVPHYDDVNFSVFTPFHHRRYQWQEPARRCWEDISHAIVNAQHFIYIAGWSIYVKIRLVRPDPARSQALPGQDMILGDLLKKKAGEGVRVLLLVWDDRTSSEYIHRVGVMATHDEDTRKFFANTAVECVLCPRNADAGSELLQDIEATTRTTLFTHHQKTVIADCELQGGSDGKRSIVSFLGGIDLCDGRYDTREHSVFRKLDKEDFHQPNFPGASFVKGGPREPWHDIHCRLEGQASWDVLFNFEQRWMTLKGRTAIFSKKELEDRNIIQPQHLTVSDDTERWKVQIFRSIDGNDAAGFPRDPIKAKELGLVTGKTHVIDRSIQDAYINAIRRAKNFIYIENQYFLGSSYGWNDGSGIKLEDIGAIHLIPKELSLKIVSKIAAGERFTVYVVIPMWPEGEPGSESVQAILDWQRRTMEMMYVDIANALKAANLSADPREYLTFFCLGNREVKGSDEITPPEKPSPGSDYARAQEFRRFMIYVHSKMMIVDDEYIIIGSANINQRSMDGARDSEIAMGGYQPMHLAHDNQRAMGKIFGFRMTLWGEHMNKMENLFFHPESVECVKRVNEIAEENWRLYISEELQQDLPGHLLTYPIQVSENGNIQARVEYFPDTKARVLGTKARFLQPILTT
ncbi:unnamed protein product [Cuscuta epithymum]|uniref:Phospholipase D n=1 Tax=Cuscuta epithymum TaxID=186058 RepID=A0AAV0EVP8_9ASTE|nr:unnamed protein product [Cuscuta epithymum]